MRIKPVICALLTFSVIHSIVTAKDYKLATVFGIATVIAFKLEY